jgi:2-polyprenyl-6-hydroxyphenyl methylase/3-demethylubiquinone-9 3-methyltransferase
MRKAAPGSASAAEIAKFDALAARWWDPAGPMRPLHAMNKVRVGWIAAQVARRFPGRTGLRLLDVGCGAGLAAEALARAGFDVLGIDAAGQAIAAARAHAEGRGLSVRYEQTTAEAVGEARFSVVTALEVIEHVDDPTAFVGSLARLLEPGGMLFVSTLNRTLRSFALAKVGAEYVLRLLPAGTHDWRKFVTPAELGAMLRAAGLREAGITGMTATPPDLRWRLTPDTSVNYLAAAIAG